jgi:hypothetical protein
MMDWLQFASSVIGSLAWPFVVVVLLILLRKQLGSLALRIEELSLPGGAKAKFKEQLESGREAAEIVAAETPQASSLKQDPADEAFLELAKNFPEAAVAQAWKEVEEVLLEVRRHILGADARQNLNSVVRRLRESNLIDGPVEALFLNLRQARNTAVHAGSNAAITPAEAVEYRDQVRILSDIFRGVIRQSRPSQGAEPSGL